MSDITIDFGQTVGAIKAVQGLDNGPVYYSELIDVKKYYRELKVPYVRINDPNYPNAREVDIHTIFRDFDADPEDPKNYDFARTDTYIQNVLDTGAEIIYRLGTSIEHTRTKYYVHPPADYDKWARICLGIIRHYNEGWADGFHFNIAYWEIWNEAEIGPLMWTGTVEQYFELYKTASRAIKGAFPDVKVGGPASAMVRASYVDQFLEYCRDNELPLDFFSWHCYTDSPEKLAEKNAKVVEALKKHGFEDAENHLTEWSYNPGGVMVDYFYTKDNYARKHYFARISGAEGASFKGAVLAGLQDMPVDVVAYYEGSPATPFSIFEVLYGIPGKSYYVFKAFVELYDLGRRAACSIHEDMPGLYGLAAMDEGGNAAVMLSLFKGSPGDYSITLTGLEGFYGSALYVVDDSRNLEPVFEEDRRLEPTAEMAIRLENFSVYLLRLRKRGQGRGAAEFAFECGVRVV